MRQTHDETDGDHNGNHSDEYTTDNLVNNSPVLSKVVVTVHSPPGIQVRRPKVSRHQVETCLMCHPEDNEPHYTHPYCSFRDRDKGADYVISPGHTQQQYQENGNLLDESEDNCPADTESVVIEPDRLSEVEEREEDREREEAGKQVHTTYRPVEEGSQVTSLLAEEVGEGDYVTRESQHQTQHESTPQQFIKVGVRVWSDPYLCYCSGVHL